jgi:hypothetical protein
MSDIVSPGEEMLSLDFAAPVAARTCRRAAQPFAESAQDSPEKPREALTNSSRVT